MPVSELSLFLPAHDEKDNLERTVCSARSALDRLKLARSEVIIIDDGSTDGTGALAEKLVAEDSVVRAVHHPRNLGYGAALRSGFSAARYEWVCWTDSDGQFDLAELGKLVSYADDYDVVVGYRARRADNAVRRINTYLWNLLVRAVFRLDVRDVDCAFKLVRRSCLKKVPPLECEGALLSTELLVRLEQAGFKRKEVGVTHLPREAGRPSGASPRVIAKAFLELARRRKAIGTARGPARR